MERREFRLKLHAKHVYCNHTQLQCRGLKKKKNLTKRDFTSSWTRTHDQMKTDQKSKRRWWKYRKNRKNRCSVLLFWECLLGRCFVFLQKTPFWFFLLWCNVTLMGHPQCEPPQTQQTASNAHSWRWSTMYTLVLVQALKWKMWFVCNKALTKKKNIIPKKIKKKKTTT